MPIYEYECTSCGERVEHLQLSSDAPLAECPKCAGKLRKLMSAPAFQFKGTGWYVTDYAKKSDAASEPVKSTSGSESKSASKSADSGGSSDAPAASKSSTKASPSSTED